MSETVESKQWEHNCGGTAINDCVGCAAGARQYLCASASERTSERAARPAYSVQPLQIRESSDGRDVELSNTLAVRAHKCEKQESGNPSFNNDPGLETMALNQLINAST